MDDYRDDDMNLDLNLGSWSPIRGGSAPGNEAASALGEDGSLNDSLGLHRRYREVLRQRNRQRWRRRGWVNSPAETQVTSTDLMVDSGDAAAATMHTGEGSNAAEVRSDDLTKVYETIVTQPKDETAEVEKDVDKGGSCDGSGFFDCNICLDLAKQPIVTSCGHLFCWPCLYKWLDINSDAKECPVCKGEVTVKNVTPIFGKGNGAPEPDEDPGVRIPDRPPARRVESLRQAIHRTALAIPMDEMIRRLGSRFDLTRDFFPPQEGDGGRDVVDRSTSLLNRILTSRGLRREHNVGPSESVDLSLEREETRPEMANEHRSRLSHLFYRRSQSYRGSPSTIVPPSGASADRFAETVIRTPPPGRSQDQPPSVDDRDSFSSITAAIHGESHTLDNAAEIDSTVSFSTSSSRRRNGASRISEVDSEDSPMPRRRRIN